MLRRGAARRSQEREEARVLDPQHAGEGGVAGRSLYWIHVLQKPRGVQTRREGDRMGLMVSEDGWVALWGKNGGATAGVHSSGAGGAGR